MEFDFNINLLFPEVVTLINWESSQKERRKSNGLYKHLQFVIDSLGKHSARAQQLTGSITSLQKSQLSGHHIYILKDAESNNGLGSVIGFIKVGRKKLFVLDHDGNHNEMNPLCILDFYVHESQQRKRCGLTLFKHMLFTENVQPQHLAVDRPSHKFICFLKKHYNLWATIPQVNNFVVFDGFFKNRSDFTPLKNSRGLKSYSRPLSRAVSDDVIKRVRRNESTNFTTNLKGVRPASSTELPNNEFSYNSARIRRKKWNLDGSAFGANTVKESHRPTLFSRYMHNAQENVTSRPPLPLSRTGRPNIDNKRENLYGQTESISDPLRLGISNAANTLSLNKQSDFQIANQKQSNVPVGNHGEPSLVMTKKPQENEIKQTSPFPPHTKQHLFETSHRIYSKPSDMISELKAKDEQFLAQTSSDLPNIYNKSWKNSHLKGIGSSWNVLGVSSRPFWSNQ